MSDDLSDTANAPQGPGSAPDGAAGSPPAQPEQPAAGVPRPPAGAMASQADGAARELRLRGIHHITAICSDMERTVAFYRDLLGLTLLKRTTNDDDPDARHFYLGDPEATPGSMVTFLEYPNMEPGQIGVGVVHHFALRTGTLAELEAWFRHLRDHDVQCTEPLDRTYFSSIYFRDPDSNIVEIATDGPGLVIN